jgi:hypothetical protein
MKQDDFKNISDLYEEGLWDRVKAGASSITGGLKNTKLLGGTGYAQGAEQAKTKSLMKSFISKMFADVQKMESDLLSYSQTPETQSVEKKIKSIIRILKKYNS